MVTLIEHDDSHVLDAHDLRPASDQAIVPVAVPERRRDLRLVLVEHRVEPFVERDLEVALDVLLPCRRDDPGERPQRHDDMHPARAEVVDDGPDRRGVGVREELAADHDPLRVGGADLVHQLSPVPDRRRAFGRIEALATQDGLHGAHRVPVTARIVDALRLGGRPRGMERPLECRRTGLRRADVDQPRPVGQQESVALERRFHDRHDVVAPDRRNDTNRRPRLLPSTGRSDLTGVGRRPPAGRVAAGR